MTVIVMMSVSIRARNRTKQRGKLLVLLYGCTLPHHVWSNFEPGWGKKHSSMNCWVTSAVSTKVDRLKIAGFLKKIIIIKKEFLVVSDKEDHLVQGIMVGHPKATGECWVTLQRSWIVQECNYKPILHCNAYHYTWVRITEFSNTFFFFFSACL